MVLAALTRGAESDPSLAFGRGRDGTTMVPDKPGIHDLKLFCFLCPRQDSHDRCHASHIYEGYFFPQVVGNGSFKCLQFKTLVLLPFTLYSFVEEFSSSGHCPQWCKVEMQGILKWFISGWDLLPCLFIIWHSEFSLLAFWFNNMSGGILRVGKVQIQDYWPNKLLSSFLLQIHISIRSNAFPGCFQCVV